MKNILIWSSLICLACPLSAPAAIYKCTEDDTVSYRDTPCDSGGASELVVAMVRTDPAPAMPEPGAAIIAEPKPDVTVRLAPQASGLTLGMFDTQVLNLRGWGRPGKITRNKSNREWREEWTYFSPQDGQRQLQFANGKLTAIQ